MKKKITRYLCIGGIVLVIILLALVNGTKRSLDKEFDSGSNIKIENLDTNQIENLKKLCKVWGVIKYYHPDVVSGKINWDYELFRVMPEIVDAKNSEEANKILYQWIDKLGDVEEKSLDKNYKNKKVALKRDLD